MQRRKLCILAILLAVLVCSTCTSASTESVLYRFKGGKSGDGPGDYGLLARDSSGDLYGTTELGGGSGCEGGMGCGTIFKLVKSGSRYSATVLYSFTDGSDGAFPLSAVVRDSSGRIYGATWTGGSGGCGTVFELSASILTTLHSFTCGADGGRPYAGVIRDKAGNLYGTATVGGYGFGGVVYEISYSRTFSVLYKFCPNYPGCADGEAPYGNIVMDGSGTLYGTTAYGGSGLNCNYELGGCGTVFKLVKSSKGWAERVLHSFAGGSEDGSHPFATVTFGTKTIGKKKQKSVIFGTTVDGGNQACAGNHGCGAVYQLSSSNGNWTETVLYRFTSSGTDGSAPYAGVTEIGGTLFGTTRGGGDLSCDFGLGCGVVFELKQDKTTWTETVLHSFAGGSDGQFTINGLVADTDGNLYGASQSGGKVTSQCPAGCGLLFEVTP